MLSEVNSKLSKIIDQAAKQTGYLIYKKNVYKRGKRIILDVRIDSQNPISHDDCRIYSIKLSELIDNYDSGIDYQLEVSSPGINRELKSIEDFKRFIDNNIKIKYRVNDQTLVAKGLLLNVKKDLIVLKGEPENLSINLEQILKANLEQV